MSPDGHSSSAKTICKGWLREGVPPDVNDPLNRIIVWGKSDGASLVEILSLEQFEFLKR